MSKAARRSIHRRTALQLLVRAGGQCEFRGCNKYLMEQPLTLQNFKLGQMAHIVAAEEGGPRGNHSMPMEERNNIENLMLLCPECHPYVDSKEYEHEYPVELLRQFKSDHESLIRCLTDYKPDQNTYVLTMQARIGGDRTSISERHYRRAIFPLYPAETGPVDIDLSAIPCLDDDSYWSVMASAIEEKVAPLATGGAHHVSVFALAPIPLLIHLGTCLSNKIPATLYQRHRDTETWEWKSGGAPADYKVHRVQRGNDPYNVALILNLSGTNDVSRLPTRVADACSIYELRLTSAEPNPTFLRQLGDLHRFVEVYHIALGMIRAEHPECELIHLFPAVPAPIAVACGRELLPKAHPGVCVYDFDKKNAQFLPALEVNQR